MGRPTTAWRDTALPTPPLPCSRAAVLGGAAVVLLLLLLAQYAVLGPVVIICLLLVVNIVSATRAYGCTSRQTLSSAGPPVFFGLVLLAQGDTVILYCP